MLTLDIPAIFGLYNKYKQGEGLDSNQILQRFEEIERNVERVIEVCQSYEAINLELKRTIRKLEEELQQKVEAERRYQEERSLIRSKIDNLLDKLGDLNAD
jgi:hypothetical protein